MEEKIIFFVYNNLESTDREKSEKHEMKTVKIMVCDDDKILQEILQRKIEKLCEDRGIPCLVSGCSSGQEVLRRLEAESGSERKADLRSEQKAESEPGQKADLGSEWMPDILFLDIQMPGKNGMEIAEELRRRNKDTILIFVTALPDYVYEAFDVGALHYLVKPFGDDKLSEVLGRALQQDERQQEIETLRQAGIDGEGQQIRAADICGGTHSDDRKQDGVPAAILVKRGGISTKVLLEDIIYAEVFNRKVMLHTTGGNIEYYGKLTELSEQTGENFYRTHRAYLVNLKYVEKYNATTIWLENGTVLLSKKQFAGFVRRYMQYISRKREK